MSTDRSRAGRAVLIERSVRVKGQAERRGKRQVCEVGAPICCLEQPFLSDGGDQFGDKQRIPASTGHLAQQPPARLSGDHLRDQLDHGVLAERANTQLLSTRGPQELDRPL
jgi:hypothetical protein